MESRISIHASLPEKKLTVVALRLAILEKAASGAGTLGFIWTTVVLLGGFAVAVERADFWLVTIILPVEGLQFTAAVMSWSGSIRRRGPLRRRGLEFSAADMSWGGSIRRRCHWRRRGRSASVPFGLFSQRRAGVSVSVLAFCSERACSGASVCRAPDFCE